MELVETFGATISDKVINQRLIELWQGVL